MVVGNGERRVRLPRSSGPERRDSVRFPLEFDGRYTVTGRGIPKATGTCQTIDVSSTGLRFRSDRPLPVGVRLDVAINWPVALDRDVQLRLIASGVVVRTNGTEIALRVHRHEFRTRGGPAAQAQEIPGKS